MSQWQVEQHRRRQQEDGAIPEALCEHVQTASGVAPADAQSAQQPTFPVDVDAPLGRLHRVTTRLPVREVLKRLAVVNGLVVMLWLVIPFTFPGEALFHIGPLHASRPGIALAAQITLKSNAIMLAFLALVATMPLATLGYALNRLRVPDKIVQLLLMTYRYVFVLEQEYKRLLRAVKIRGFQPATNLHTYRTYAYVVGWIQSRGAACRSSRRDRAGQS